MSYKSPFTEEFEAQIRALIRDEVSKLSDIKASDLVIEMLKAQPSDEWLGNNDH